MEGKPCQLQTNGYNKKVKKISIAPWSVHRPSSASVRPGTRRPRHDDESQSDIRLDPDLQGVNDKNVKNKFPFFLTMCFRIADKKGFQEL